MNPSVASLHNHTPFSDGAYTIDELCEAHLQLHDVTVSAVGICDALFCTPASREVTSEREFERLFAAETRRYVEHVHEARRRWAGRVQILCGCSVRWSLNREMLGPVRELTAGFDYILFEGVDWPALTQIANQARRFPCPVGLAGVDVSVNFPKTSMEQVVRTLANARIFFELGTELWPLPENDRWFNLLPKHRVMLALGADTHDDLAPLKLLRTLADYAARRGLDKQMLVLEAMMPVEV